MVSRTASFTHALRRQLRLLRRHLRHGRASTGSASSEAKRTQLETLFREVNSWLAACEVGHVLAYGTLLGWHREGRLLPHDRDVDFAVLATHYERLRDAGDRLPAGFTLHDTSHRHHGPKLYVEFAGWDADIYFFADEPGGLLRSTEKSINPGETTPFPRKFFLPRRAVEFLGAETWVPAQPEALLLHHYGYLGADAVRDPVTRYFRPRA